MKKTILGLALSLITMSLSAQVLNKKYDLFYLDGTDKTKPQSAYYIGAFLRNDTIFITPGAIVNVVTIQNEDSTWKSILLKPFREKQIYVIPPVGTPTTKPPIVFSIQTDSVKKKSFKQIKKQ